MLSNFSLTRQELVGSVKLAYVQQQHTIVPRSNSDVPEIDFFIEDPSAGKRTAVHCLPCEGTISREMLEASLARVNNGQPLQIVTNGAFSPDSVEFARQNALHLSLVGGESIRRSLQSIQPLISKLGMAPPLPVQLAKAPAPKRGWGLPVILGIVGVVVILGIVGVVGIVAAIAIPNVSKIHVAAEDAKSRRDAQSLASVFAAAEAAGLDFTVPGGDLMEILQSLTAGKKVESGPFAGMLFSVPRLTEEDLRKASKFLAMEDGRLLYIGNPSAD
jgi:hypothetical protein